MGKVAIGDSIWKKVAEVVGRGNDRADKTHEIGMEPVRYSPKPVEFSYFYKFDDVRSFCSNPGVFREVSKIRIVKGKDIWPDDLWPYEE